MVNNKLVAIDARMIESSGIGTYIKNIINNPIYDYAIGNIEEIRRYNKTIKIIEFDAKIYSLNEQIKYPKKLLKKYNIKLIHYPHYNVPMFNKIPFVCTIHDLTHLLFPEYMKNKIASMYSKILLKHASKKSKAIFTVSNNSKKDIMELLKINDEKIHITYNAIDSDFHKLDEKYNLKFMNQFNINPNKLHLLYVGNLKPHKNLKVLLEAMPEILKYKDVELILAGKAFDSLDLKELEKSLKIENNVIHTGLVSKEELIGLYSLADIFVFPSLYEGFGIPPLESMSCNTPVIAANTSSIPEVLGDSCLLFNPNDHMELKDRVIELLDNKELYNDLVLKGLERVKKFSWDETNNVISEVITNILK